MATTTGVTSWLQRRWWQLVLGIAVIWGAYFGIYTLAMDQRDDHNPPCSNHKAVNTTGGQTAALPPDLPDVEVKMNQDRADRLGVETIEWSEGSIEGLIAVMPGPLENERGDTIRVEEQVARATGDGLGVTVELCIKASEIQRLRSGEYAGRLVVTDPRVGPREFRSSVMVQSRVVFLLLPLSIVIPLVVLLLAWVKMAPSDRDKVGLGYLVWAVPAIAATVAAWWFLGASQPDWGGLEDVGALVLGMWAAASGVALPVGATTAGT